tara:strand:- start:78 stop:347 length:270 start_codon:yes stop_codon:yes gene_type:complete
MLNPSIPDRNLKVRILAQETAKPFEFRISTTFALPGVTGEIRACRRMPRGAVQSKATGTTGAPVRRLYDFNVTAGARAMKNGLSQPGLP